MPGLHFDITGDNSNFLHKLEESRNGVRSTSKQIEESGMSIEQMFGRMTKAAAAFGAGFSAQQFVSQVMKVRGEFQQLEVAFNTMLGSKEKADTLMSQLVRTAAITPFDLQGVANGAKQLLAYGTAAEDVNGMLVRLGDIAAGLSIPLNDLVWLYGTTMTQGRLFTQDLRQFQGRGIPLADELAKQFGVTKDKVGELVTAGRVGFPEVQKAIEAMTNEGGRFGGLMEAQSKTITGQISNIEDAIDVMYNKIGQQSEGLINNALSGVTGLVENYEKIGEIVLELVGTYGAYKAILITITALQRVNSAVIAQAAVEQQFAAMVGHKLSDAQALAAAKTKLLTIAQQGLIKSLRAAGVALAANPYIIAAAAIAGVSLAIYKVVTAENEFDKATKRLNEASSDVEKSLASEVSKLTSLERKLSEAKKGTEEYNSIKKTIVDNYGQYYKGLDGEIERVGNLSTVYGQLVEKMRLSIGQRKFESFFKAEQDNLDKTISEKLDKSYDTLIKKYGKDKGTKLYQQVFDYVIRGTSMSADTWKQLMKATFNEWGFDNSPVGFAVRSVSSLVGDMNQATQVSSKALDDFKAKYQMTEKDIDNILSGSSISGGGIDLSTISKEISDATAKIATLKQELADLRSGKTSVEAGKTVQSVIEVKVKELKTAEDALATLTGQTTKENSKRLKNQQELSRSILDSELRLQASRIAAMKDGKDKRVLLADQEYKETLASIQKEREEYQKKIKGTKGKENPAVLQTFTDRESAAKNKRDADVAKIVKDYSDQMKAIQNEVDSHFRSQLDNRLIEIDNYYKEHIKKAKEAGEEEEGYFIQMLINKREAEKERAIKEPETEEMNKYLKEYGSYLEKRQAITDLYHEKIKKATTLGEKLTLVEEMKKELAVADDEAQKKTSIITKLFSDMSKRTVTDIRAIADEAQKMLDYINEGEFKTDSDGNGLFGLTKEQFDILSKSPEKLQAVKDEIANVNREADRCEISFNKVSNGLKKVFSAGNDAKKLREGLAEIEEGMNEIMQAGQFLSITFSKLGDSFGGVFSRIADGLNVAMDAVSSAMDGAKVGSMFGPIGASAGAAISVVSSLVSAIAKIHDKKNEQRIQRLQDHIDTLDKSYERLEKSIEKAYSKDASKLIDQQNKLLEQQKILIQNQIREEEDKKKTDKGRIKEWQNQIDEINNVISDNKEKQIDAIFGEDLKSAIDDFSQAYADAWSAGNDRAKSSKEFVKNTIKQMILEAMKAASSQPMEELRKKLSGYFSDGIISSWEREQIEKDAENITKDLDQKFGWANEYLKGTSSSQSSTKGGFSTISQDAWDVLEGRFTAFQMSNEEIKNAMLVLTSTVSIISSSVSEGNRFLSDILNISVISNSFLEDIAGYTKRILLEFGNELKEIKTGLKCI